MLLFTDPVDEFWVSAGDVSFEENEFKSATRAGADLADIKRVTVPTLFISSGQDELVPATHMQALHAACGAS
uniref:hypothetical protein n=1 Tax=Marinovum algicola TaxID=42444 RepID=UPI0024B9B5B2